uniref:Uncharacterized protein n=1 Tax=Rhizophora mucronata TaxID=61149 RepID=A0A2P2PNM6_RHIMU
MLEDSLTVLGSEIIFNIGWGNILPRRSYRQSHRHRSIWGPC